MGDGTFGASPGVMYVWLCDDLLVLEVKLVGGSEWWLPWLPVVGALIAASAAFVGILISNRTNRRAITAADDREWVRWRREKLFDLAGQVLETSNLCSARLGGCLSWTNEVRRNLTEINNLNTSLPHTAARIRLVTDDLDAHIDKVFRAVWDLFMFVADNHTKMKKEMADDDTTTFDQIKHGEDRVKEAQDLFINEVRRVSFALGPNAV